MKIETLTLLLVAGSLAVTACSRTQTPPVAATVAVAPQPVRFTTELSGRTAPYRVVEVRPQVSGLIQEQLFTEGANVAEGQVLYQLDPGSFQADLDNAQAGLRRAEASLPAIESRARLFKTALAEGVVSQQECDEASAALNQVHADIAYYRAMVESASINLSYTRVVAPIAGRIGRSSVPVGVVVAAHQPTPLAIIQELDPISVDMPLVTAASWELERWLRDHQDGSKQGKVQLVLEDGTVYPAEGTFDVRESVTDPITGTVILRAHFPNPNRVLQPAMLVRVIVQEGDNNAVLARR